MVALSKEIYSKGGALSFKAFGTSMYPFIRNGDILTFQPVEASDLRIGDIVLFQSVRKKSVAHRLVQKQLKNGNIFLKTRGDALLEADDVITGNQIMGRVFKIQRGYRIIQINHGSRQLAAIIWLRCSPLGPMLIKLAIAIRNLAARIIR
jgi:signal peptidase